MDIFTKWILLIAFLIIYGIFLFWDAFKREEPYGNVAYVVALLPANFFWYCVMTNDVDAQVAGNPFNALSGAAFLVTLWFIAMLRDIFTTRKQKDLDDVFLALVVGIIIQLILYAVLPSNGVLPQLQDNASGATGVFWGWWIMPNIQWTGYDPLIVLWFRLVASALVLCVIIPMIMDLRGTKVKPAVLIIITAIFALPFSFLAYIWMPAGNWGAILFLLLVLLLILLLTIAK
jgi:hypothetical protein